LKEHTICFRLNIFVERFLKIRSFANKITVMFLILFIISAFISSVILSYFRYEEEIKKAEKGIALATLIRQQLSYQKLDIYVEKLEKILKNNKQTEEVLGEEKFLYKVEKSVKDLPYKYYLEGNFILTKIDNFIIYIDKDLLTDVIMSKAGIVSIYKPIFFISEKKFSSKDNICHSIPYNNSNFYLVGCIKKETILNMAIISSVKDSIIYSLTFISILLLSTLFTRRVILFPLNFLMYKLNEIENKGLENVRFTLHKYGTDELAKISFMLENFRRNILNDKEKFRLIFQTVSKMLSISNNIHTFSLYVLNQLDNILNLKGSLIIIKSDIQDDIYVRSDKYIKNNIDLNLEKSYKTEKSIDEYMKLIFIGILNEDLSKEDEEYLDIILSDLIYSINIYKLATEDFLTKLPNRRKILADAQKEIERAIKFNRDLSIIMIDLDDFKIINDLHGHDFGDLVIIEISKRIKNCLRETDLLGRYGGEEFLAILPETNIDIAKNIAEKIREEIKKPININNIITEITATVAITDIKDFCYNDVLSCIKILDLEIFTGKKSGKDKVVYMTKEEVEKIKKAEFEAKFFIKEALKENKLIPFFQPIVDKNKNIIGYEILARIKTDEGYIPAFRFIQDAIKFGYALEIDEIIHKTAIQKIKQENRDNKLFFLNLSKTFIHSKENIDKLIENLSINNLKVENFVLEITEEEAITEYNYIKDIIRYAKYNNLKFALDDFGAGYSNFIYIKHFDIDIIKLDGSLSRNIHLDKDNQVIVESIIKIAKYKNIKVLAEMVETEEEFDILNKLGCDYFQGYYFAKPDKDFLKEI